ncbi:tyrosine-type recombinase/integrase [Acidovorax sp.]|uniref:tyrosine-type recombinase/integrase n=1 Tax=Acidovorax sp. TaxID=1872122 RepID=UPI00258A21A0|nr:tyrosine-type recombinase/integrase [Acidovorax sp.]
MSNISKVSDRAKLKPRREPYWAKLAKGCFVGFRKMTAGASGTWVARNMDEASGKQQFKALGDFSELADHQRYDAASKAAQVWFEHLGKGGSNEAMTVAGACKRYVQNLRDTKGDKAADDAQGRFDRHVFGDAKLSGMELTKLTPSLLDAWRKALANKPAPNGNKRSDGAVNRDMSTLRAALNYTFKDGLTTSDFAWRSKLAPIKNATKRRDVYLDREQRKKLIECAAPDMADFLRALCMLPLRPGALAALTVGNFDKRLGVLTIGKDKAGGDRKISLPDSTTAFFASHCKDKLPGAFILTNSVGSPWDKDVWGYQFEKAAALAALPSKASTYSIRHSTITDLIHAGVDSLTVAQLAGTSVAMIEKHYGHLTRDHARSALAALAL